MITSDLPKRHSILGINFRFYNEYAENRLRERKGQEDDSFLLSYLNIFNMTALRQDGHVAASDCLHYELPAVVDWWNHLLYTNLLDIAAKESNVRHPVASVIVRKFVNDVSSVIVILAEFLIQ